MIYPTGTIHSGTVMFWRYFDGVKFSRYFYLPHGKYKRNLARYVLMRFDWKFINESTFETVCPQIVIEILKILLIRRLSLKKEIFQRCKDASLNEILEELKPLAVISRMEE